MTDCSRFFRLLSFYFYTIVTNRSGERIRSRDVMLTKRMLG